MRQFFKIGVLCLMVMLLFSCSTMPGKVNPLEKLVPADAVIFVEVRDFGAVLTNFDDFTRGTVLESMIGIEGSQTVMTRGLMDMGISTEWVDLTGSFGIAILPSEGGLVSEPNIIGLLPLADLKNFDNIKEAVGEKFAVKLVDDYAVICSRLETCDALPVKRGLDLSPFSGADRGDIIYYIDFHSYLKSLGINMDALRATVSMVLMSTETKMDEKYVKLGSNILSMFFDFFEQIDKAYFRFALDGAGLTSMSSLYYKDGMGIAEWGKKLTPKTGIKDSLTYMRSDSLISSVLNIEQSSLEDFYRYAFDKILGGLGLEEAVLEDYLALTMDLCKNFNDTDSMSFDLSYNWDKLKTIAGHLSGEKMGDISYADIFDFSMIGVTSITNKEDVQKAYMEYMTSGLVSSIFEIYDDLYGISTKVIWEPRLDADGFMYDRMSLEVTETGGGSMYADPAVQALLTRVIKDLFNQLKIYMAYNEDEMFIVTGGGGLDTLKQLVEGKLPGNGKSLGETRSFKEIRGRIPADAQMISSFSPVRLINIVAEFPGLNMAPIILDEAPGMVGYIKIEGNRWDSLDFLAKEEIAACINAFIPLVSSPGL